MHSLNINTFLAYKGMFTRLLFRSEINLRVCSHHLRVLTSPHAPHAVDNQHMLHYIRDKTAVPYFSNLVWFIGSHVIELDKCVQTDEE